MWFLFACLSALFAGLTAVLAKRGIQNVDSNAATALRTCVVLVFAWLMVFITGAQAGLASISPRTLLFLCLSGLATGGSWLCYFRALQLGDVNKVTPIDKSSTLLTMLLAFLFLGEQLTWLKGAAMVIMLAGTLLMIQKRPGEPARARGPWLMYALGAAAFASLQAILAKIGIQDINSNLGTALRTCVVLVMAWVMVFITGKQGTIRGIDRKSWVYLILSGLATGGSWLCYYRAMQTGDVSVVVPIDKMSIVVTIAFSYFVLKEKLSLKAGVGFALVVAGTGLLLIK